MIHMFQQVWELELYPLKAFLEVAFALHSAENIFDPSLITLTYGISCIQGFS